LLSNIYIKSQEFLINKFFYLDSNKNAEQEKATHAAHRNNSCHAVPGWDQREAKDFSFRSGHYNLKWKSRKLSYAQMVKKQQLLVL